MALIHCPECGKEISSTSGTCVHCGAKITDCPVLETKEVSGNSENGAERQAAVSPFRLWKESNSKMGFFASYGKYLKEGTCCGAIILIAIAFIVFRVWDIKDSADKALSFSSTQDALKALYALGGILIMLWAVMVGLVPILLRHSMAEWLKHTNTDAMAYLKTKKLTSKVLKKELGRSITDYCYREYSFLAYSAYRNEHFEDQKSENSILIFLSILLVALALLFMIGGPIMAENQMIDSIHPSSDSNSSLSWILPAILAILLIVIIVVIRGTVKVAKKRTAWIYRSLEVAQRK